ncbi:MAG TPA: O-antigen ligase family protein [Candidatus Polarisedimenticolaceae bacterium]|nr:O-antigen ligase family protein [Candidatus Polarisedimenticolaceae bacterium]
MGSTASKPAARGNGDGARQTPTARATGYGACLLYLIVDFGRPMDWIPALEYLRLGMVAAFWGFAASISSRKRPIPKPMWYMIAFLLAMAWGVPWAKNNAWAFWGFEEHAIFILGCVLPLAVLPGNVDSVRKLMTFYFFLHVPMAIHGLMYEGTGAGGWIADENDLALGLNAALGVGMYLAMEAQSAGRRFLILASMAVMVTGVVSTISRGGFVGLATMGAYLVVFSPKRGVALAAVAGFAIVLVLFAGPTFWHEVDSIKTADQVGDTGEERLYYWGLGWKMFLDNPVIGVGTRNFPIQVYMYEDKRRAQNGDHAWGRAAHSFPITLLAEHGLVGTSLVLLMLGWVVKAHRRLLRAWKEAPTDPRRRSSALLGSGIVAGLVGFMVSSIFLSSLYYPIVWVLVALFASLDAVSGTERESELAAAS